MFNFGSKTSEVRSASTSGTEMADLSLSTPCPSCSRPNCPCGSDCECGPFCRCKTSDIIDAVKSVHPNAKYTAITDIELGLSTEASSLIGSASFYRVRLSISGMTCTNCSSAVIRCVNNLSSLVLHQGDIVVRKDCGLTSEIIAEEISDAGYDSVILEVMDPHVLAEDTANDKFFGVEGDGLKVCELDLAEASDATSIGKMLKEGFEGRVLFVEELPADDKNPIGLRVKYEPHPSVGPRYFLKAVAGSTIRAKVTSSSSTSTKTILAKKKQAMLLSLLGTVPVFMTTMVLTRFPSIHRAFMSKLTDGSGLTVESLILFIFATPVQFGSGRPFYVGTMKSFRSRVLGMDSLIAIGTSASYLYGVISMIQAASTGVPNMGAHFFETSAVLITFVLLGKYLQAAATRSTSKALTKLMDLAPKTATLVTKKGGDREYWLPDESFNESEGTVETEISVDLIQTGDVLKLIRTASVPCDGTLLSGELSCNEAMITGEPLPAPKIPGADVIGGTTVAEGFGYIRAVNTGEDTALSQIVRLMETAQGGKAPVQLYADKISGVFVPFVTSVSLASFVIWFSLSSTGVVPDSWIPSDEGPFMFSFIFAITTLVIACPCALGLAAPTAIMTGTGVGAQNGVLIKGGEALESAANVDTIIFDKTGTLTMGKPAVEEFVHLDDKVAKDELLWMVLCAERSSEHPLAVAVVKYCEVRLSELESDFASKVFSPPEFQAVTGKGVSCNVNGRTVAIGNRPFMKLLKIPPADNEVERRMLAMEDTGATAILVAVDGELAAVCGISDELKDDSPDTISRLRGSGVECWMVTGDNARTARAIARRVGLDERYVVSEALPATKVLKVESLQKDGKVVAMVGDGINDSPALVQANLGVAIGAGTDIAIEAADMVLVRNCVSDVAVALDLSKAIFSRIKLNFVWALLYNSLGIPIAAGMLYPWWRTTLPPVVAAAAMALSSVSVVLSSLHLRLWKPKWRVASAHYDQ